MRGLPGTLDAEGLFWALLFSLPTGVGVALAAGRSVNAPPTVPLALTMGGVTFVVTFLLVAAAAATNPEESPPGEGATTEPGPDESSPPEH
ncbi:hypothetical protein [Haloglomus litoreum]|uniref:hypothetical protein n=1 Tax=Haloglomus litoreum TaxID=3034026 RepID=UPI0023E824A3|nr:hypothetical protein [Haloglomus sp. DT116]